MGVKIAVQFLATGIRLDQHQGQHGCFSCGIQNLANATSFPGEVQQRSLHGPAAATLRQAALASGHVTAEQFDAWVIPENMLGPAVFQG